LYAFVISILFCFIWFRYSLSCSPYWYGLSYSLYSTDSSAFSTISCTLFSLSCSQSRLTGFLWNRCTNSSAFCALSCSLVSYSLPCLSRLSSSFSRTLSSLSSTQSSLSCPVSIFLPHLFAIQPHLFALEPHSFAAKLLLLVDRPHVVCIQPLLPVLSDLYIPCKCSLSAFLFAFCSIHSLFRLNRLGATADFVNIFFNIVESNFWKNFGY